jgi:hypothetical protein
MATVEEIVEVHLLTYLTWEEIEESMPVITKKIFSYDFLTLSYKSTPERPIHIKDGWYEEYEAFTFDSVENVFRLVRDAGFEWCIQKMRSMK